MDDVQQIDAEEIIGEIREQNRTHQQGLSRSDAASPRSEAAMDADLASLQSSYDIYHIHFTSHRKGVGRLIVLAKQVLRKLLTPILEQQVAYNTANTRIVRFLDNQLEDLQYQQLEGLRQQRATMEALRDTMVEQIERLGQQQEEALQKLREQVVEQIGGLGQQQTMSLQSLRKTLFGDLERRANDIHTDIASKEGRMIELEKASLQLKATLNRQERRLGLLLEEARKRLPNPLDQEQLQHIADEERHALDALYFSFEDRFRHGCEAIKGRLCVYLGILSTVRHY